MKFEISFQGDATLGRAGS